MVIINEQVKNVLNRLLLSEVAVNGTMNFALDFASQLNKLDESKVTIFASHDQLLPYNWRIENVLIYKYKNYVVSYTKSVNNNKIIIVIEEIAIKKGNGYDILTESTSIKNSKNPVYGSNGHFE